MNAEQYSFHSELKSRQSSTLAIIFFLLGAPSIYSALRQRSHYRLYQSWWVSLTGISLLVVIALGLTSQLVF